MNGFGSGEIMYGQRGRDTLSGGSEVDYLIGGAGNDKLQGGGGAELYFFGPGWGKDSITDTAAPVPRYASTVIPLTQLRSRKT